MIYNHHLSQKEFLAVWLQFPTFWKRDVKVQLSVICDGVYTILFTCISM